MSFAVRPLRTRLSRAATAVVGLGLLSTGSACDLEGMTYAEMREAMDQVVLTGQAISLENSVTEITTSFTIGDAVDAAREEVASFLESQMPCSDVTYDGDAGLTIDFGDLGDACEYRGRTYAGVVNLQFSVEAGSVDVAHTYEGLTDGIVTIDGTSDVRWTDGTRHVINSFTFANDTTSVNLESDRIQTLIDPELGLEGGVEVNGWRRWGGENFGWRTEIDGVEVRLQDPVPQAGSYTVTTDRDKEVVMSFARVDEDTIEVRITGGWTDRRFNVTSSGAVSDEGEV